MDQANRLLRSQPDRDAFQWRQRVTANEDEIPGVPRVRPRGGEPRGLESRFQLIVAVASGRTTVAVAFSGDTEVTKIARRSQSVKRALPRKLRERQPLRPVRTAQGRKLRTTAYCKPAGTKGEVRKQYRCRVVKRKGVPTLLLDSKRPLRVRVVQRARGTKRLLPYKRFAGYRYLPKRSKAIRL